MCSLKLFKHGFFSNLNFKVGTKCCKFYNTNGNTLTVLQVNSQGSQCVIYEANLFTYLLFQSTIDLDA